MKDPVVNSSEGFYNISIFPNLKNPYPCAGAILVKIQDKYLDRYENV